MHCTECDQVNLFIKTNPLPYFLFFIQRVTLTFYNYYMLSHELIRSSQTYAIV